MSKPRADLPTDDDWQRYNELWRQGQEESLAAQRRTESEGRMPPKARRKASRQRRSRRHESTHARAVLALCRRAGCPELAEGLIASRAPVVRIKPTLARAQSIKRACARADLPELAAGCISASGWSVDDVRAFLAKISAIVECRSISPGRPSMSLAEIYRERNASSDGNGAEELAR